MIKNYPRVKVTLIFIGIYLILIIFFTLIYTYFTGQNSFYISNPTNDENFISKKDKVFTYLCKNLFSSEMKKHETLNYCDLPTQGLIINGITLKRVGLTLPRYNKEHGESLVVRIFGDYEEFKNGKIQSFNRPEDLYLSFWALPTSRGKELGFIELHFGGKNSLIENYLRTFSSSLLNNETSYALQQRLNLIRNKFLPQIPLIIREEIHQDFLELYDLAQNQPENRDFLRMLYFSTITISTVGFGDIYPTSTATRSLTGLESFIGIVLLGLFVNALSNKNR